MNNHESLSTEDARKLMDEKVSEAYAALSVAQAIADAHKLAFHFSPAYGMGGWYSGDPNDRGEYSDDGWMPSSQSC